LINIFSPINSLGFGVHANNVIKSLVENGQEINLSPIGEVQMDSFYEAYVKTALQNRDKFDVKEPSVFIFHDDFSNQACGTPLLTFSIFETTQLKDTSRRMLEHGPTDVILTTTQRHAQIIRESNINKPVEVVTEGVDETIFNTIPVDKYIDTKKFTYITSGKREERKNTDLIIRLFINSMKEKEVALICHTFNPFLNQTQEHPFINLTCWAGVNPIKHGFEYKGFNGKAHLFTYNKCDIYFTTPTIPVYSMSSLYHSANVGIQVSRGEGWDLVLSEMLACGLPTISTSCLGHSEYLINSPSIQNNLVIGTKGTEPAIDNIWFKGNQGCWDILDIDIFLDMLQTTFSNSNNYESKSDELADYMSVNYSWNNAVKQLIDIIAKYKV
jgi:glycosyltransferase involved in cell wall biosynthesis